MPAAKVRRLLAVAARPNIEISGLATTCTVVMPTASTNKAKRKQREKFPSDDAGHETAGKPAVIVKSPDGPPTACTRCGGPTRAAGMGKR